LAYLKESATGPVEIPSQAARSETFASTEVYQRAPAVAARQYEIREAAHVVAEPVAVPAAETVVAEPVAEQVALAPAAFAAPSPEPRTVAAGPSARPGLDALPVGVMDGGIDTAHAPGPVGESEHQPTGDELLVAAEAADLAGDEKALHSLLVWTARAYAREGKFEAGLDATHRLLRRAPSDVDAHLVLVELYVARNWNSLAAEKLALLGRLAELDNDEEARQRLCAVASRAFPNDDRLGALCN
jgi:hypothetical protein